MLYSSVEKIRLTDSMAKKLICEFPFGKLQIIYKNKIETSPIVCLISKDHDDFILTAHFPKSNNIIKERPKSVQLFFETSHRYISPSKFIENDTVLPTWSFCWLELTCTAEYFDDPDLIQTHLLELYEHLENSSTPKRLHSRSDNLLKELMFLKFNVEQIDSVVKMGNEKDKNYRSILLETHKKGVQHESESQFIEDISNL